MVGGAGGRTQWIAHRAEHRANVNQEQHFSRWALFFPKRGEKKTVKTYADVRVYAARYCYCAMLYYNSEINDPPAPQLSSQQPKQECNCKSNSKECNS